MDEAALIQSAKAGRREAAAALCELHWRDVYRTVYARMGDRSEAEDVTQEAFLRLWRNLARFEGERLGPYLRTIALNLCRNRLRDLGRHPRSELSEALAADVRELPEAQILRREEDLAVREALGRLEPDQRRVLELRLVDGLSAAEAGELLGRTPEAVRALQYRALVRLRTLLRQTVTPGEG